MENPLESINPEALRASRFSSKLSFEERCAVLAYYHLGVNPDTLAHAFGLVRQTVSFIYRAASPHYRSVRTEMLRLGREEFIKKYTTADLSARINGSHDALKQLQASGKDGKKATLEEVRREYEKEAGRGPNPRAKASAGLHRVQGKNTLAPHMIEIAFIEAGVAYEGSPLGWYFKDLDGDFPTEWLRPSDEGLLTSGGCLRSAVEEMVDATPKVPK